MPGPHVVEGSVCFLLSQLGFHVSRRFGESIGPLGLDPPHAGILRLVGEREGETQQRLATSLGIVPSRMVALLDDLEERGLVERRAHPTDRRARAVHLTARGRKMRARVMEAGMAQEAAVCDPLSPAERTELLALLGRLADHHGLAPGIHPGLTTAG